MTAPKRYLSSFILLILVLILVFLFRPRIGANGVLVSTRLADDFGVSINSPNSPLHGFCVIPDTPYVFCEIGYEPHVVVIIDLQKGKRILSASWYDNADVLVNSINHGRSEVPEIRTWLADCFQLNYIYMSNTYLMTDDSNQPLILMRFRTYNHKFELVIEKWKFLGLNRKPQDVPYSSGLMPVLGSNRIVSLSSDTNTEDGETTKTYTGLSFEDGNFCKKNEFQVVDSNLAVLEYIPEVLISEPDPDYNLNYISRDYLGVLSFTPNDLAAVYSGDPRSIDMIMNIATGRKGIVYLTIYESLKEPKQLQIIELSIKPGPNNTLLPTFRWVGKNIPSSGECVEYVSKNRQHLYFYPETVNEI